MIGRSATTANATKLGVEKKAAKSQNLEMENLQKDCYEELTSYLQALADQFNLKTNSILPLKVNIFFVSRTRIYGRLKVHCLY